MSVCRSRNMRYKMPTTVCGVLWSKNGVNFVKGRRNVVHNLSIKIN
jgi:hypothetical protein